jgi:DNA repair protein RecO (recombination protein O)
MSAGEVLPAIILRTRPLGDADLLVILLSARSGKLEAAATRARGSKRRFTGGLHPGMVGEATVSRGRGALLRLSAFMATRSHAPVGQDLHRFAYVAYLCELCDELVLGRQEDPRIFVELNRSLGALIEAPPRVSELRRFELVLLDCLGLLPSFECCCVCGGALRGEVIAFDAVRGGALCERHDRGGQRVPLEVLRLALGLTASDGAEGASSAAIVDAVEASASAVRRALRDLSVSLLRPHLRRPLRSLAFLAQLPQATAGG